MVMVEGLCVFVLVEVGTVLGEIGGESLLVAIPRVAIGVENP